MSEYSVHEGWVPFGWHIPYLDTGFDVPLDFSEAVDDGGMPLYERLRGWKDGEGTTD